MSQAALTLVLAVLSETSLAPVALAQPPGPELFAKEPQNPLELWDAVDYLVRTGQGKKALPYLEKFTRSRPDDATLIAIRNRYGPGSILQLDDDPATRRFTKPLIDSLAAALREHARQPERITRFIHELTRTPEEQDFAVSQLRAAGSYAVPFLVEELSRPGLSARERELLTHNIGRLDRTAVPALIAVLNSPDPQLAAAAATALGAIGDNEAIPHLMFTAAFPRSPAPVRSAAQEAITRLTGRPFPAQPHAPVQVLTAAARKYHRHQIDFPEDPVVLWSWDDNRKAPTPVEVPRHEAETLLGSRLAREALLLDPGDHDAQVIQLSLTLRKALDQVGFSEFAAKDRATFAAAVASGPSVLSDVLKTAIADAEPNLAAVATMALARVTDRTALATGGRPHPLVDALYAPGRHAQFAAASTLAKLAPNHPFPGSSRIVPTLARFLSITAVPHAVVIDSNPNRGSQLTGFLVSLGYVPELEPTGAHGFRAAAESAGVELILVSFDLFKGWGLNDTLANLKADSRTATIPVAIYGPLDLEIKRPNLAHDYPGIRFLVQPADAGFLQQQLKKLPPALTKEERLAYAREAAALLMQIANQRNSPLQADLAAAEPALAAALSAPETGPSVAPALAKVPSPDAQRSLADQVLDPSMSPALRTQVATHLTHSIERFGPLLSSDQEARLATTLRDETNPDIRATLTEVARALRTRPRAVLSEPAGPPRPAESRSPKPVPTP